MKLVKGNLWDSMTTYTFVTGNSYIRKDGALVMGRGAALELKTRIPNIPFEFGNLITKNYGGSLARYGILFSNMYPKYGMFQVKYNFKDDANLELISFSVNELLKLTTGYWEGKYTYSMNFPGIGWGRLRREDVLPLLTPLPDCVTVYEKGEQMKVIVLNESGYEEAAIGFSLSYNSTIERAKELLPIYAFKEPGETKFLESMMIWIDVNAPRFWWQEADTYRLSTKQSESTMHTILKRKLNRLDFEYDISDNLLYTLNSFSSGLNDPDMKSSCLLNLKNSLPEGFLQRRIWCMSYKTLQNIYLQRRNHRLPQWQFFCDEILKQVEHPEFLRKA